MRVIILLALLLVQTKAFSGELSPDKVLSVDGIIPDGVSIDFPEPRKPAPKAGDFELLSHLFMSSPDGERWAVLKIRNVSSHQRILDEEHIVGQFAGGERRNPISVGYKFSGKEAVSITMSFGVSKFPLLNVEMRN